MKSLYTFVIICSLAFCQVSREGTPKSFIHLLPSSIGMIKLHPVDKQALLEEDKRAGKDVPFRFGHGFKVSYDLFSSGTWETLSNGDRVWRLAIESLGAYSINIIYDVFFIPQGGEFFVYSEDKSYVIGAFTELNNKDDRIFATQPVPGDKVVLEYNEPFNVSGQGQIRLEKIIHAYRNVFGNKDSRNYGDSGSCNNNVNCSEGDLWQDHNRSVAMILTSGGSRICTGALVNNVRQDQTQNFLTADHCLGGNNNWIFMFNYESPGCSNQNGPTNQTVQGSTLRASRATSDFALLELTEAIPSSYNVNYAGWSAVNDTPQDPVCIHHPSGDIKKISFDYDSGISDGWNNNDGSHWRIASWEDGTTEPGSSGAPLFDDNYRIVGQLHGGQASCSFNFNDYFGKFSASWDWGNGSSSRLKNWLDPDNTGTLVLDSYDTGGGSPELTYSPDQLEFSMGPDETDNQIIIIINSGGEGSVLSYEIDENSGWISVNPDQGEIEEGSSQNIYVTVNTNGMNEGTYQSVISITSNGGNIDIPIVLTISGTVNINQNYDYGWNLVGLPVETQSNFYANLFPYAVTTTLYSFISGYGYQSEENLVNGTGYWLRMSQSNTTAFTGEEINAIVIPLLEGWNLISGISSPVPLDNIVDLFELIVPNTIYGYNSGYFLPEDIIPGKAYWLRSSGNGNVGLYTSNLVSSKEMVTQKLILMK